MCKFYKVLHALVCQAHTFGPVISFTLWIPGVYYFFQGVLKSWGIIVNKPMHSIMIIRFRSSLVQYTYTKYITVFNPTTLSISLLYLLYLLNTNKSTFQILTPFCGIVQITCYFYQIWVLWWYSNLIESLDIYDWILCQLLRQFLFHTNLIFQCTHCSPIQRLKSFVE